jgi:hypothetical protein
MLGLPAFPTQETSTVCMGCRRRVADWKLTVTLEDKQVT